MLKKLLEALGLKAKAYAVVDGKELSYMEYDVLKTLYKVRLIATTSITVPELANKLSDRYSHYQIHSALDKLFDKKLIIRESKRDPKFPDLDLRRFKITEKTFEDFEKRIIKTE